MSAPAGPLHADAVRVLTAWDAPDGEQDGLRAGFLDHLAAHADGVWRECAPGHITASTAVLDASRSRVLLTLHRKLKAWLQLGGHCEAADVTLHGAAAREAAEESGIEGLWLLPEPVAVDRHRVPCHPGGSYHFDVQYVAIAPPGSQPMISDESDDLRWFDVTALPTRTDHALHRLVTRAIRLSG